MFSLKSGNFSGHETFPLRYGWLKKGIDAVLDNPTIFAKDDALITLGVGKNMVLSIKHWCITAKLINKKDRVKEWQVTDIGKKIFGIDGLDPYLEDPKTLWLVHWLIASNDVKATSWFYIFSYWHQPEFTKDIVVKSLISKLKEAGATNIAEATIKRDIECFIRTYVPSKIQPGTILEDTFDCPLSDLDLINEIGNKTYCFHRGDHHSLQDKLFIYMVIDFWFTNYPERKSLTFEEIAYKPGSPGRILRMDEGSLSRRLESIEKVTSQSFIYDETSGLKQVYKIKEINLLEFLNECYQH